MEKKIEIPATHQEKATFAGGCFWCLSAAFKDIPGIVDVVSGYTGGTTKNPTYEVISSGSTGHYEAVQVTYDPTMISYSALLDLFWHSIDPMDQEGQFADKGTQYRTAIFYHTQEQQQRARDSKMRLENSGKFSKPLATKILPVAEFYPAEEYHQDFQLKNPERYQAYKKGSLREQKLNEIWKKESKDALKIKLTPLQYHVTQKCGTELPFANEYWNNKREGIYVDRVSGEPLFSSLDKFDSSTGWPSFTKPLENANVVEKKEDGPLGRIEVKSTVAGSHLGHRFDDGPEPTGQRYCINSASLRFIPKEDLEKEGYGSYKSLFK